MKRVFLGVILALVGVSAHAQSGTPLDYYKGLRGLWAGRQEDVRLVYSVRSGQVRVEGESCAANPTGPAVCRPIDQGYLVNDTRVMRDDPQFGSIKVEVVEMTDNKIVLSQRNPILKNRVAITTEELSPDKRTLLYTVEVQENGQSRYSHQFTLDRVGN